MNLNEDSCFSEYNIFNYGRDALAIRHGSDSEFDCKIRYLWQTGMDQGYFRYKLSDLETKILPGKFGFVAQKNINRAVLRRQPQVVTGIQQSFNPDKFNFTKISKNEILFKMMPSHWSNGGNGESKQNNGHPYCYVIINVSPLEFCNCLLVPNALSCLPQVLTTDALRFAVETLLLSSSQFLRIGFNSLGAYASVNHLHFHMYYMEHQLYLETAEVSNLSGECFVLSDYPAEGFVFQILDLDVESLVCSVMKLVQFLLEKDIAHNVFLTRATPLSKYEVQNICNFDAVRIYVWARETCFGVKNMVEFNPAFCELAGHIPIKSEVSYQSIVEEAVLKILTDVCHATYSSIVKEVQCLFDS